ncbi:MAG: hypothetical protein CVT99_05435 [Bacteroidetes bacterium HGW-Bacteroidetes-16]|nr:MAG: hypothetical protein CVT99_05435 [Bacteroidetes bacterium HGW-Bacteroidetes-16]
MKKFQSFIRVTVVVGAIYLTGALLLPYLKQQWLANLVGIHNRSLIIGLEFLLLTLFPYSIFIYQTRLRAKQWIENLLAFVASVLPIQLIINFFLYWTHPHVCWVRDWSDIGQTTFAIVMLMLSMAVLFYFILYFKKWRWMLVVSLIAVFVFDILFRQGWINIWTGLYE